MLVVLLALMVACMFIGLAYLGVSKKVTKKSAYVPEGDKMVGIRYDQIIRA